MSDEQQEVQQEDFEVSPELEALAGISEHKETDGVQELSEHEAEQAAEALAGTMVAGLEKLLQLRYPAFEIDHERGRSGVEALKPVAADFVVDMPEWLRPYSKYLAAGLFIGGCVFEAHRQEKILMQKAENEQEKARGDQSKHGMAESA